MTKLYLDEIVTLKDGQTVVSPTATYSGENSEEVYRQAEVAFHGKCNYNLQQTKTQKDFLVQVITETGKPVPEMKRFYRFAQNKEQQNESKNTEEQQEEQNTEG